MRGAWDHADEAESDAVRYWKNQARIGRVATSVILFGGVLFGAFATLIAYALLT